MKMNNSFSLLVKNIVLLIFLVSAPGVVSALVTQGIDEQAKLPYWEVQDNGMSLRLIQRLPDQTRAFFLARGFTKQQVEVIATSCIFQTVFKNISNHTKTPSALTYNLKNWQVIHNGQVKYMKVRKQWDDEWIKAQVKKPQRLAFEWALYPTTQTYKPGDYNWGMSVFNLKPGETFDLKLYWEQFDKQHSALIKGMQCATDSNPPSPGQ